MFRTVIACIVLILAGLGVVANAQPLFEDHFDGTALAPEWIVWGDGPWTLSAGDLEFVTQAGDFEPGYEPIYGQPHHMFLLDVASGHDAWSAVTRVRYNTPDEAYEQVLLLAFEDADNYVKISYQKGGTIEHVLLKEHAGVSIQQNALISPYSDYFWLRLDREGPTYTSAFSPDGTLDADLVTWTNLGSFDSPMVNPLVGLAGWNTRASASGELAEFDYFRLVPEPATLGMLGIGAMTLLRRRSAHN